MLETLSKHDYMNVIVSRSQYFTSRGVRNNITAQVVGEREGVRRGERDTCRYVNR